MGPHFNHPVVVEKWPGEPQLIYKLSNRSSCFTIIMCTIISQYTSNITSINIYMMKFPRSNLHIFRRTFSWRKHPFSPTSAGAAGAAGLGFLFLRCHGRPAQRRWCGSGCRAAAAQRRSAGNDLGSTQGFLGTFWDGFLVEIMICSWFVRDVWWISGKNSWFFPWILGWMLTAWWFYWRI